MTVRGSRTRWPSWLALGGAAAAPAHLGRLRWLVVMLSGSRWGPVCFAECTAPLPPGGSRGPQQGIQLPREALLLGVRQHSRCRSRASLPVR